MRTTGLKLQLLREKHALTLDEMAFRLCLSPQYYAAIEAGFVDAPSAVLDAFALVLGIHREDISKMPCTEKCCAHPEIYDMLGLFAGPKFSMDRV